MTDLSFRSVCTADISLVFSWLAEPHVRAFWDSSQAHREDIINFSQGRPTPSGYFGGKFSYWLGMADGIPFALIMTVLTGPGDPVDSIKLAHLSKTGTTYGIDYMIGNPAYVGKEYGARTLQSFITFFQSDVDPTSDVFLIDPAADNPRARHVYEKAGFKYVATFVSEEPGSTCHGKKHFLLVKS